ncbi:MAG: hypothetical protein JXQ73_09825 [Phycisphaerae bacterium]|nr:hypothetical protein [Phycisphaerae bacterium]
MRFTLIALALAALVASGCTPPTTPTDLDGSWVLEASGEALSLNGILIKIEGGQPTSITIGGHERAIKNSGTPTPDSPTGTIEQTGTSVKLSISYGQTIIGLLSFTFDGTLESEDKMTGPLETNIVGEVIQETVALNRQQLTG